MTLEQSRKTWRQAGFWSATIAFSACCLLLVWGVMFDDDLFDRALAACSWIGPVWGGFALVRQLGKGINMGEGA